MFMSKIKTCTECGVPLYVSKGQTWFNNGVIAETKNPDHRLLFFESDILDNLVDGIGEIIGVPIEHIVVESKRRATREYLEKMIPRIVLKTIYLLKPSITASKMADMAKAYGLRGYPPGRPAPGLRQEEAGGLHHPYHPAPLFDLLQ